MRVASSMREGVGQQPAPEETTTAEGIPDQSTLGPSSPSSHFGADIGGYRNIVWTAIFDVAVPSLRGLGSRIGING